MEPMINLSPFWKLGRPCCQWFASTLAPHTFFRPFILPPRWQHHGVTCTSGRRRFPTIQFCHISTMLFFRPIILRHISNTGPFFHNGWIMSHTHTHNKHRRSRECREIERPSFVNMHIKKKKKKKKKQRVCSVTCIQFKALESGHGVAAPVLATTPLLISTQTNNRSFSLILPSLPQF